MNRICKLAIPMEKQKFSAHYGQTTSFEIYEISLESRQIVAHQTFDLPQGHACGMAQVLRQQGVQAVVVGNLGAGAFQHLVQAGLEVYAARAANTPDGLVRAFLEGKLPEASANCNHHESEGHHHHHHGDGEHTCQCQSHQA